MLFYLNVTCFTVFFFHKAVMWFANAYMYQTSTIYDVMVMLPNLIFSVIMHAKHYLQKLWSLWYILLKLIDTYCLKGNMWLKKLWHLKITLKFGKSFHLKSISVLNRFWTSLKQWDACTNMQLVRPRNTPDCGSNIAKIILFLSFSLS